MGELKPCPFCGGEAKTSNERFERTLLSWVYCTSCGSAGGYRNTEQEAIEAWNTRVKLALVCDGQCDTDCPNADVFTDIIRLMCNRDLEKADPETAAFWRKCWPDMLTCRSACGVANVLDSFCSECGEYLGRLGEEPDFCPNCWAKVVE